jgi:hypothetical protein
VHGHDLSTLTCLVPNVHVQHKCPSCLGLARYTLTILCHGPAHTLNLVHPQQTCPLSFSLPNTPPHDFVDVVYYMNVFLNFEELEDLKFLPWIALVNLHCDHQRLLQIHAAVVSGEKQLNIL